MNFYTRHSLNIKSLSFEYEIYESAYIVVHSYVNFNKVISVFYRQAKLHRDRL